MTETLSILLVFSFLLQVYEKHDKKLELVITIVEAGYLLVLQGKECLVSKLSSACSFDYYYSVVCAWQLSSVIVIIIIVSSP